MNTLLLMLFIALGSDEATPLNKPDTELLNSITSERRLFASIEQITKEQVHIIDLEDNTVEEFGFQELIENELSVEQTIELEKADLMLEYQGDLYYLKG
ncbi:MAG: hypothetical protein RIA69_02395 [Cyclobacteriaceae bacterium]